MARKPEKPDASLDASPDADDTLETALSALVDMLPRDQPEIAPTAGLLCEARTTLVDGVHLHRGWELSIADNRLVYARHVGG